MRLVRETIGILEKRRGAAADRFWRSTVRQQIGRMQVCGLHDRNVINDQIEKFALVVFDALRSSAPQQDGDAA
ncbi:msl0470 [Mesorhizobium japonicum MAFF 303099]|uniref:Msl0470 protein n=1 Tax=Mesorhizobium japonicum (strain LMG 29417 / CECT 9101 / MAFF 303099) TaxID=266835 RepID=Q98MR4_RHILO|nr:msl0470 [Mesorhizobium japonicum MAFF 303099]